VFELRNLIDISDSIARSALAREESRGAHSRIDFPSTEKAWATKNVVVRREDGALRVELSPLLPIPDDLRVLAEAGGGA
jgi:succinate dehydrogenase / fumarate reductase flavoprotein subunit